MANPVSSVDVPLSLFSGWNTELSPPDQPEGASPANNDVVFTPGAAATRPGLNRVFATPIDSLGNIVYQKSFVTPSGVIKNLYFTGNDSILWVEDLSVSPGTAVSFFQSAGATFASSVTAQGREYIALSDGQHGADVPLTYDGTNLWRTTQDGPAVAPVVESVALSSSALTAASGACLTRLNNTVTANTATPHNMQVGYQVQISNVPDSNSTTVNQTYTSYAPNYQSSPGGSWGWDGVQWRSNFNPGTSPLSDFVVSGFYFNIPSTAVILGIEASLNIYAQSLPTSGTVAGVALWNSSGQIGTEKTSVTDPSQLPTPFTSSTIPGVQVTYGNAGNTWGASLTPAIVNDPSFGFALSCACDSTRVFLHPNYSVTIYYTLSGTGTVSIISTIKITNEQQPGMALVTTTTPHGLSPQEYVNIVGPVGAAVGGGITNVTFAGGLCTITTSTAHNLSIGSQIQVAAATYTTASGIWSVATIPTPNTFAFYASPPPPVTSNHNWWSNIEGSVLGFGAGAMIGDPITGSIVGSGLPGFSSTTTTSTGGADTGTVTYIWPLIQSSAGQNYFQVVTAPTPTTFTVQMSYPDGTWTGGTVGYIWGGIFPVTAVLSSTQFQYQQYGPNGSTTALGTVTPYGQCAPGLHQCQLSYLLASGDITAPSPPVTFTANGGQYVRVSQMATGPSNVVARILQFTGAGGAYFYYIPVPAIENGLTVSTATQVNDNSTTAVLLDFSDKTLYAATAVSKPGNNLSAQIVLDPCAGFFTYASRLLAWGGRNKINNLLNMGFDADGTTESPQGWILTAYSGNTVALPTRPPGSQWRFSPTNNAQKLSQSAYRDCYGAPIVMADTAYKLRAWVLPSYIGTGGPNLIATLSSALTGFSAIATIHNSAMNANGLYLEAAFTSNTLSSIPIDLMFSVSNSTTVGSYALVVDELEIIPVIEPYLDNQAWITYANNFGGFDEDTGTIGADDDLSPIRNFGTIRKTLYMVTGTGLHETSDNGETEPGEWDVDPVADNCGAYSIAAIARNPQGIGSAGKDWMMWSGPDGAQIFTGQKPMKVSQEIQSIWDAVPAQYAVKAWTKNDENNKRCYFGLPTATGAMLVYVLDYRNIDGAAIAENPPIHISFTGKMIVSDLTRKWTKWTIPASCAELMYRGEIAQPQIVFGGSNAAGAAQSYILNPAQFNDDDFGVSLLETASYTTYFFVSHEMEGALQVGSHRHIYTMAQVFISGVGTWTLTPLACSLNNPFPASPSFPLSDDPFFDVDFGINVLTTRCAFRIQAQAVDGNCYFKLQKLVINMQKDPNAPVRGTSGGSF